MSDLAPGLCSDWRAEVWVVTVVAILVFVRLGVVLTGARHPMYVDLFLFNWLSFRFSVFHLGRVLQLSGLATACVQLGTG